MGSVGDHCQRCARLFVVVLLGAFGVAGCSDENTSSTPQGEAASTASALTLPAGGDDVSYRPEDQPIFRQLYDRLGLGSADLRELADRARLQTYLECMAERGFDMPADAASPIVRLPRPSSSPVDDGIEQIKAQEAMVGVEVPEQQMTACLVEIDSINPFNDLFGLVEGQTASVSDRVRADERYLAATAKSASCAEGTPPSDGRLAVSDQVTAIVDSYVSGAVGAAASLHSLEQLRPAASRIDWSIDGGCDADLMKVERELVAEYQQRFLDENPGFVDGLVEEFKPVVDQYLAQ